MAHQKRQTVPMNWSVSRKGTTFVVRPSFDFERGLPVLIVLRDILKVVRNKREAKKAIHAKNVLINQKPARDFRHSLLIYDTLSLQPGNKNYRIVLDEGGKFRAKEIDEKEAKKKVSKVINKTKVKNGKIQINLMDGQNYLSDTKCNTNDSVIVDLEKKQISKCLPLAEGSDAVVFSGKHSGQRGKILSLKKERKMAQIKTENASEINVLIKQLMVVD